MKKLLALIIALLAAFPFFNITGNFASSENMDFYSVCGYDNNSGEPIISSINVKDFGAEGDGVTDDWGAFKNAYNAAAAKGGAIIYVPPGNYRISRPLPELSANSQIRGHWNKPDSNVQKPETVLTADFDGGSEDGNPFMRASAFSVIRDLKIYYKRQSQDNPVPYPFTIGGTKHQMQVYNITLINSYNGINSSAAGFGSGSGIYISDIYGTVLKTGILCDYNLEFSEIQNVHFSSSYWNAYDHSISIEKIRAITNPSVYESKAVPFKISKADGIFVYNIKADSSDYGRGLYVYPNSMWDDNGDSAWGIVYKTNGIPVEFSPDVDKDAPYLRIVDSVKDSTNYNFKFAPARFPNSENFYNVKNSEFGAKGDGTADDTLSIRAALAAAENAGGGTVFLPSGRYNVSGILTVPKNTELRGESESMHFYSPSALVFSGGRNLNGRGMVELETNSGIHGLTILCSDLNIIEMGIDSGETGLTGVKVIEDNPDFKYASAIMGKGSNVWAEHISIVNSYTGVDFSTYRCDNFVIKGMWGYASKYGILIGGGSQNGRLEQITFTWAAWSGFISLDERSFLEGYSTYNTAGYLFGDCSKLSAFSLSAFGLAYGALFGESSGGAPEGINIVRLALDIHIGLKALYFRQGNNITIQGLMTGNGRAGNTKIDTHTAFNGKARIYIQEHWGKGKSNLGGKDIIIYDENSAQTEILPQSFMAEEINYFADTGGVKPDPSKPSGCSCKSAFSGLIYAGLMCFAKILKRG